MNRWTGDRKARRDAEDAARKAGQGVKDAIAGLRGKHVAVLACPICRREVTAGDKKCAAGHVL